MKGRIEIPENMLMIVVGVLGTLIMIIIVYVNFGSSAELIKDNIHELNAIDATYVVEKCLKNENDLISERFLNENMGKGLCELCGICKVVVEVRIRDLENGNKWEFDYSALRKSEAENSMFISIETEDEGAHVGKLHVYV